MAGLTFDGFDLIRGAVLYRGGLGAEYSLSPDGAAATFKFPHGSRIRLRRGPYSNRGPLVVVGVTTADRPELVLHDESAGLAFILAGCFSFNDLCEKHDPAPVPAHEAFPKAYVEMAGPLEYRYAFNTDSVALDPKYGVSSGTKLFVGTLKDEVTVVGEFLSVLWVTPASQQSTGAVPLVGCTNEATLLNLHGVRDTDGVTGSTSPRTPRTPGRARGNGSSAPYTVDASRKVASCVGAFGAHLEVATDDASLAPFGVVHGSRLLATKGIDLGKGFTVVGVKAGSIYILGDGDRKVTCCRNCTSKADLEKLYGFEPTNNGGGRTVHRGGESEVIPVPRAPHLTATPLPRDANEAPPLRSSTNLKHCWTSHGRQAFDVSHAACGAFGYSHGQTVEATVGGERGKRFHIFGVRHGTLWVVPQGAEYATPLRHCTSKADVDKAFGFIGTGKCDLSWLYEAPKPMGTPVSSPRRAESSTTPNRDGAVPSPLAVAREDPYDNVPMLVNPPRSLVPTAVAASPPKVVPIIPKLPISVVDQRQPSNEPVYTVAPDTSSSSLPAASVAQDRTVDAEPFRVGLMPITRHFLKAYALFKLRLPSESIDPQAFHGYFAEAPQRRLNAAMAALPAVESQWRQFEERKRQCTFSNATVDEIIETLNRAPHLCP